MIGDYGDCFVRSREYEDWLDLLNTHHTRTCWETFDEVGCRCDTRKVPRPR